MRWAVIRLGRQAAAEAALWTVIVKCGAMSYAAHASARLVRGGYQVDDGVEVGVEGGRKPRVPVAVHRPLHLAEQA